MSTSITSIARTGRHLHMRPVVRPRPTPAIALATVTW